MKTAEEFLKEKFMNPQSQDWFVPVCEMMEAYAVQCLEQEHIFDFPKEREEERRIEIHSAIAHAIMFSDANLSQIQDAVDNVIAVVKNKCSGCHKPRE